MNCQDHLYYGKDPRVISQSEICGETVHEYNARSVHHLHRCVARVRQFVLVACLITPSILAHADEAEHAAKKAQGITTDWFTFSIHPQLPLFDFHILRETMAIEIFTNGVLPSFQILTNGFQEAEWEGGKGLVCCDMNFDGFGDLMALRYWGATGNVGYNCWLYDTNTSRFVFSTELSDLCQPAFDATRRTIHEYSRGGSREFTSATFVWDNGRLTMIEEVTQQAVRQPVREWLRRVSPVRLRLFERDPVFERVTRVRTNGVWKVNRQRLSTEDVL